MPVIRPNLEGGGEEKRTTFRPPWVKDGPCPLPCPPTNPWLQQAKQGKEAKNAPAPLPSALKKTKEQEIKINVDKEGTKKVNRPKETEVKIQIETEKNKEVGPVKKEEKKKGHEIKVERANDEPPKKSDNLSTRNRKDSREQGTKKVEFNMKAEERQIDPVSEPSRNKTPVPPPPPMAPPPPPPPMALQAKAEKPISKEKAAKLDALRSRPRRRPDWTDMMKEVEKGIKLNHVKCNDRSAPIIPMAKAKGQFVYDSEKQNAHNELLKEIQHGVHLKKTKTNDRSKPILEGLRKFRRQMTIEEIITKSASVADVVAVASEPDELDDIDKVRDDLQSTKQMLALELRNKEALERENKRLMARLANLEAELEKEKMSRTQNNQGNAKLTRSEEDDKLITKLKEEAAESAKMSKQMEVQYHKTAEELDLTRAKLESAWLKNAQLEMELKSKGNYQPHLTKQASTKKMPLGADKKRQSIASMNKQEAESDTATESETEEEEEDEDEGEDLNETSAATREERELKLLNNKLKVLKEKKTAAGNEKRTLKSQLSKLHHHLKEEKKKYKLLQKEVEKMASIMKDVEGESNDEEEEEIEEDDEEEDETETETESEEEESEDELPENASHQDKVNNLNKRIRHHETLLTRAKKGNYLLKANIDRRQDDVNRQKEMSLALQEDLNAVLSELG